MSAWDEHGMASSPDRTAGEAVLLSGVPFAQGALTMVFAVPVLLLVLVSVAVCGALLLRACGVNFASSHGGLTPAFGGVALLVTASLIAQLVGGWVWEQEDTSAALSRAKERWEQYPRSALGSGGGTRRAML